MQPLSYLHAFPWPPAKSGLRIAGQGVYRGRPVIWLEPRIGLRGPRNFAVTRTALDPQTHRTIVEQSFVGGRFAGETVISQRPDLSASKVSFVVPKDGVTPTPAAPSAMHEPWSGLTLGYGLPAARNWLGRTPLWLGPRFRGHVLRSVTVGTYSRVTKTGAKLRTVRFVRFYYIGGIGKGYAISVEEFGPRHPYFFQQGPRPGTLERSGMSVVRLVRHGLLFRITSDPRFRMTRVNSIALAKTLRPLPAGLRTLPTLHEQ